MSRRRRGAGFTLVELIVAMTLTTLVAGSTVLMLRSATGARRRVDRYTDVQREAGAAMAVLVTALRNAHRTGGEDYPLLGTDDIRGSLPADRIRFFTLTHCRVRPGVAESDVCECEFLLHRREGNALSDLVRRRDPTRNDRPDGGGVVARVAANIVGLDIRYLDAEGWRNDRPEERQDWPLAVRVRIIAMAPEPPVRMVSLSRLVNFPYRPATTPAGLPGKPTEPPEPAGPGKSDKPSENEKP
jgi:hypothetical protein